MSNDIHSSATRAPTSPAAVPAPRVAEVQGRAQLAAQAQAAVDKKHDPQEARRTLEEASEHLNQQMARNKRDLSFSVDEVTNTVVLTVKNRVGEVVRQIPSETALRVAHNIENMKGLMEDQKS
ncbi:flagellar protein FlaG [Limnohabitans sp. 2KL-3]|uniref:flagellar protein FlaG n=1 Tax=Limnohabitans sp. 2KL-3 TaxID=1100700 RepID=UPI000A7887D2|nr:flagellar protein FlaG [Limnohabitans sp. 2KL-3]